MKITIDIPEIEALNEAQTELDNIDRELTELVQAIAQGSQAPQGKPFAVQLQQLLTKALNTVKNAPPDDTQVYIERYAEGYSTEIASRVVAPYVNRLGNQIKSLNNKLASARPYIGSSHISIGQQLHNRLGQSAFLDLQQHIAQQVEAQLTEHLNALEKVTE